MQRTGTSKLHMLSIVCVTCLWGCAANNKDMLHFLPEREHEVSAIEYRVGIPDAIAVIAPRIEEIDGTVQRIHPDGKISLKLLGDVKIVGMTAKEVAAKLELLLSRYYVDPKVSVQVVVHNSKKFYVYGEGLASGPRPFTGRDTLLDSVMPAVSNYLSWTSRVKVIRPSHGDDPPRELTIDVDHMVKSGDWSQNILLEPNDVVYVPPTPLAAFTQGIRAILLPVGPAVQAYSTPAYMRDTQDLYSDDYRSSSSNTNYGY